MDDKRGKVEIDHAKWLIGEIIGHGRGHHGFNVQTTPMVAYLEAFGLFSYRFTRLISHAERDGAELYKDSVQAGLQRSGTSRIVQRTDPIEPALGRDDVEGAVYVATFVHFASLVTLSTAVEAYYRSDGLTFYQYRLWILTNTPTRAAAINHVRATWNMWVTSFALRVQQPNGVLVGCESIRTGLVFDD